MSEDNWKHRSSGMRCRTCWVFVRKISNVVKDEPLTPEGDLEHGPNRGAVGRCHKRAPTMEGFPVVFGNDWCGDHKIDEDEI